MTPRPFALIVGNRPSRDVQPTASATSASSRLEHLRQLDAQVAAAVDRLIDVHIGQLEADGAAPRGWPSWPPGA